MTVALKIVPLEKECSCCKTRKAVGEFYFKKSENKFLAACKDCVQKSNRASRAKHNHDPKLQSLRYKRWREKLLADPVRAAARKAKKNEWNRSDKYYDGYYQRKFGISLAQVQEMLARQNGRCANLGCSCKISLTPNADASKAVVDHCHGTGAVRSLMCVRCNSLLGHIENNENLVPGLMDYLNKHQIME